MTTYRQNCSPSIIEHPAGILDSLNRSFRQWLKNQRLESQIAQERRQLLEMSEEMLHDLGISRAQAEIEARQTAVPPGRQARNKC